MIIAVWGNNYSGKSTLSIKLSLALSQMKKNVVLVDTNFITPQIGIWYPKANETTDTYLSLSNILQNDINRDILLNKMIMLNEHLGLVGYQIGELTVNNIMQRSDTPYDLLNILNTVSDYVVIDCQTNITQDLVSFSALELSDKKILCYSPDNYSLSWHLSNVKMLADKKYKLDDGIRVVNKIRDISPITALEKVIGHRFNYYFPSNEYLEREVLEGTMGAYNTSKYKQYSQVLNTLVKERLL